MIEALARLVNSKPGEQIGVTTGLSGGGGFEVLSALVSEVSGSEMAARDTLLYLQEKARQFLEFTNLDDLKGAVKSRLVRDVLGRELWRSTVPGVFSTIE